MSSSRFLLVLFQFSLFVAGSAAAVTEHMFPNDALATARIVEQLEIGLDMPEKAGHVRVAKAMLELRLAREAGVRGQEQERLRHLEIAQKDLDQIKSSQVDAGTVGYVRAVTRLEGSLDVAGAVEGFEAAMAAGMDRGIVREQLATLYYVQGRHKGAVDILLPVARHSNDPLIHRTMAAAYLALGDLEAARTSAIRSIALGGGSDVVILKASAESQLGLLEEAEASLRSALDRDPSNRGAMMGLITVLRKSGKEIEARRIVEDLRRAHPNDHEVGAFIQNLGEPS